MAKRADESMTPYGGTAASDDAAALRGEIERTRGDMSRTVNEIEERLSPAHLKEQVASVTADLKDHVAELKQSAIGGYHEVKDHVKEDLQRELTEAKQKVGNEITHARTAVRDATVGRVEHMVHDARETVTDAGSTVLDTIKANPIPAALIGVGLGWLLMSARSGGGSSARRMRRYRTAGYEDSGYGGSYGYSEGRGEERNESLMEGPRRLARQGRRAVGEAVHSVEEGASHLAQQAQEKASEVGESVSHLAQDAGHRVAEVAGEARVRGRRAVRGAGRQIMRAERGIESTLRENPLALGAVAIAIGAAIGLALPHTHVEDEWMGEAKERLVRRAEGVAGEAIQKAEESVAQLTGGEKGEKKEEKTETAEKDTRNGLSNGLGHGSKSPSI